MRKLHYFIFILAILPALYFGTLINQGNGPFCFNGRIILPDGRESPLDVGITEYVWNPFDVHPSYDLCGDNLIIFGSLGLIGIYFLALLLYRRFKH